MERFACSICPFFGNNNSDLLDHLRKRHTLEHGFRVHCRYPKCGTSYNNIRSFQKHVLRYHNDNGDREGENARDFDDEMDNDEEIDYLEHVAEDAEPGDGAHNDDQLDLEYGDVAHNEELNLQSVETYFLLKMKEYNNLSEKATKDVIDSMQLLFDSRLEQIKKQLSEQLDIDAAALDEVMQSSRLFEGLDTPYQQDKRFKDLGMISPQEVKLGERQMNKKHGNSYRFGNVKVHGFFVPFMESLEAILNMPEMSNYMRHQDKVPRANGKMCNVFHGNFFRTSPFFQAHPNAIAVAAYLDDFEVVNPIGAHRKTHKITAFYYILLNIPPYLQSKLQAIQLIGVAKTNDLKEFGHNRLLKDFIEGLSKLQNGHVFEGIGKVYGTLAYVTADTPAAQLIGGFKEGVGGAFKPCRRCDVLHTELTESSIVEDEALLRNETQHQDRLDVLDALTGAGRKYWSKRYGINSRSVLLDVDGFQITKCILFDPMHIFYDNGVVDLEFKLMMNYFIDRNILTLQMLNKAIQCFEYSDEENADKPQNVSIKMLERGSALGQTAASMKNLACLLPFMIGEHIEEEEEHWMNFLRLTQIAMLCISPIVSENTVVLLRQLIATHNQCFRHLYPDIIFTPKMHYMVHFPKQLYEFGPGRQHWCMRFEAKNGEQKLKKWKNFKCLPKSIATRHQRRMLLYQTNAIGRRNESYLYEGDEVTEGKPTTFQGQPAMETTAVRIHGHTYKEGSILLKTWEDEIPVFVRIQQIVVTDERKYLKCFELEVEYIPHINGFKITGNGGGVLSCLDVADLQYRYRQTIHKYKRKEHIVCNAVDNVWQL